jgi:hypothetical protein
VDELLIHTAGTGAARVATTAARAACTSSCARLLAPDGEAGKLPAQPFAVTFGACDFLFAHYDGFKLVVALLAHVFKNRHIAGSFKIITASLL